MLTNENINADMLIRLVTTHPGLKSTEVRGKVTGSVNYQIAKVLEPNLEQIAQRFTPHQSDSADPDYRNHDYYVIDDRIVLSKEWVQSADVVDDRKVAITLVNPGTDTIAHVERFLTQNNIAYVIANA